MPMHFLPIPIPCGGIGAITTAGDGVGTRLGIIAAGTLRASGTEAIGGITTIIMHRIGIITITTRITDGLA